MKIKIRRTVALLSTTALMAGVAAGMGGCTAEKEIVFWNPFTGPDGTTMQELVDAFNETEPEYTIKNVSMAGDDMYTKLPTVLNSGKNMPDMGIVHYYRIPLYAQEGMIAPIDSCIEGQENIIEENYISSAWEFGNIDGERYSVPWDLTGWVVYYNQDLADKYAQGVLDDNLVTLEELESVAEKCSADGVYAFDGASFTTEQFMAYMMQRGISLEVDGQPNINTPEAVEVLETMKEIMGDGVSTKPGDDGFNLFVSNQVVFKAEGNWTKNSLNKDDYPELNWGETNDIAFDNETMLNWMSSHQFVRYENESESEEVRDAKNKVIGDFLEFLRQNSSSWAEAGHIPASIEASSGEEFESLPQSIFMSTEEEQNSLFLPQWTYYGYINDALNSVITDILNGEITPEEGLEKAQNEVVDKIEEHAKASESE